MKLTLTTLAVKTMIVENYTNENSARVRRQYVKTYFLGQLLAMVGIQKQIANNPDEANRKAQMDTFKKMCLEVGTAYSNQLKAAGTL